MEEKLRETAARYSMLPPGARVLCACSGGADSTALLHFLCHFEGITLVCAHFNHRLRGAEADRDAAFVRDLCVQLGVELVSESADVAAFAAAQRLGTEEAARTLRYAFLERAAAEQGCDRIATAHHAEDNAETILWNLTRGCGTRGLAGIPPVRGKFIRPMLNVTRQEILEYLQRNGLRFVDDSSNALDDNPRNRIRHHVLPLLKAENPAALAHFSAAAEALRADEKYLDSLAETYAENGESLDIPTFLALPEAVGVRVLRGMFGPLQRKHFAAIYDFCRSEKAHGELCLPGLKLLKEYGKLTVKTAPARADFRRETPVGVTVLPELGLRILREPARRFDEIHNSFNTFYFKCDSIRGMMFTDRAKGSDRLRLPGRGCTKTVKNLFQEARVPPSRRARTPALFDEEGVLAVCGFGVDERCAAAPGDFAERITIMETAEEK